jgi:hypothetical protein
MSDYFGDMFGGSDAFTDALRKARAKKAPAATPEKGVQLRGRKIDDSYYIRAADVAALLEVNGVLPGVAAKLRKADA